jgi:hypothetical protein
MKKETPVSKKKTKLNEIALKALDDYNKRLN